MMMNKVDRDFWADLVSACVGVMVLAAFVYYGWGLAACIDP